MIRTLAVSGYRSVRDLALPLTGLDIVTGANGSGKSNVYRALRLIADMAQGGAVGALAREGGLEAVLWAGPEGLSRAMRDGDHEVQGTMRKGPIALRLGFAGDELGYLVDLGIPQRDPRALPPTMFGRIRRSSASWSSADRWRVPARWCWSAAGRTCASATRPTAGSTCPRWCRRTSASSARWRTRSPARRR
ncbi:hypothetical protein BC477_18355 [Clavibacter michiganensis subsp. michiganensis]|uniref:ATPase AAA-type core domain-containing protein n=1 Tax=Clavibacter michiganensis subsp. michiganensis TaxID=33013 RepID=A0A251XG56_CLAMM|nr:hypothetical protein BC477_18355 [Clavibacter michiganensis subsp. michiganensis]OUE01445.1 hypothetical protein CMMCAS07_14140 [Clavibacter michiganensis subsp. michiganensis]